MTIGVNTKSGGLEGLYQRRSSFGQFDPLEVDGYPAANAQYVPDTATCQLNVGVNDTEMIKVNLIPSFPPAPDLVDPCGKASDIATQIIQKLAG